MSTTTEKTLPADEPAKAPGKDSLLHVIKRNKDLEKRAFRATNSTAMLSICLVASLAGNVIQGTHRPEPRIFAQDSETHTLVPIVALTQPIGSKTAVVAHVSDAVGELNSIDFLNYKKQLMDASVFFTPNAWKRYMDEFENVGLLDQLTKRQIVQTGAISRPPVIVSEGEEFGVKTWQLEVPYKVKYVAAGYNQTLDYIAQVKVVRVSTTVNPKGIAIAQYVSRQASSDLQ